MKKLDESEILRLMREEYSLLEKKAKDEIDVFFKQKGEDTEKNVITPDLKIKHSKTGVKYTVDSVSLKDVILITPEGEKVVVPQDELERDYILD